MKEYHKEYHVECYNCGTEFVTKRNEIKVTIEDESWGGDLYYIHTYLTYCPTCQQKQSVDILDDHDCCLRD
jgi:hypothetical protein